MKDIIALNTEQKKWINDLNSFPEIITLKCLDLGGAPIELLVGERNKDGHISSLGQRRGQKGFVLKVYQKVLYDPSSPEIGALALKIVVPGEYDCEDSMLKEFRLSKKLENSQGHFSELRHCGKIENDFSFPGGDQILDCFLSEWTEGETLEKHLEKPGHITASQIISISKQLVEAVSFLKNRDLKHDDLHPGNILLTKYDPAFVIDTTVNIKVVVIDMGSLKPIEQKTEKVNDDRSHLIRNLSQCYNALFLNRAEFSSCPNFFREYRQLISELCDEDEARYFPNGFSDVISRLDDLSSRLFTYKPEPRKFKPFDEISAEFLPDDARLVDLFVEEVPWLQELKTDEQAAVTGPRGCGKSMAFRFLAAKTQISQSDSRKTIAELNSIPFLGVYVSCVSDLQNDLIWLNQEDKVRASRHAIESYFQLVVLRELFETLSVLARSNYLESLYLVTNNHVRDAIEMVNHYLANTVNLPKFVLQSDLHHMRDKLESAKCLLKKALIHGEDTSFLRLPTTLISDVTSKLITNHQEQKRIVFLLDDYTSHRLGKDVQRVLNKIVWERREQHRFKTSCEKYGFTHEDMDGTPITLDRELVVIDTGDRIIQYKNSQKKTIVSKIINKRLKTAGWEAEGDLAQLFLGNEKYPDTELAKTIREKVNSRKKIYPYHGLTCLANLWNGDLANLLHLMRIMFKNAEIEEGEVRLIPQRVQNEAIVGVSKAFTERIKNYHPYGKEMNEIVSEFCGMAASLLSEGDMETKGYPQRKIRVEHSCVDPTGHVNALMEKDEEAGNIARELLRRAIFLELEPSKGKEGIPTVRWQLRSIFLPAADCSLLHESYIDMKDIFQFLEMLVSPVDFREKTVARYSRKKRSRELDFGSD